MAKKHQLQMCSFLYIQISIPYDAVEQAVACAPVTQRARVQSPVEAIFLGEVFSGFILISKTNVRKVSRISFGRHNIVSFSPC